MPITRLNLITCGELQREVGNAGLWELRKLGEWLTKRHGDFQPWESSMSAHSKMRWPQQLDSLYKLPPRIAHSIISKSELELFGRSTPRFAIRLELKGSNSFVNIRRLGTLSGQILGDKHICRQIRQAVLEATCIADAYFQPPEGWNIITAPLGKESCAKTYRPLLISNCVARWAGVVHIFEARE